MKTTTLLFIIFLWCNAAHAAETAQDFPPGVKPLPSFVTETAEAFPPETRLTLPQRVKLIIREEGKYTLIDYPARSIVDGDLINLIPGEKVFIEADVKDNRLIHLRQVDKVENEDKTIEFEFRQIQDGKSPDMILNIVIDPAIK